MSAKVKPENNDGNNISSLGHSTGTQALSSSVLCKSPGSKSVGIFSQEPRELQAQVGL